MSNAMRSGKRWLAGAAAGALGAGMLTFAIAAPAAQATVSTVTGLTPGLTVIKPAVSDDTIQRAIPISVYLTDASGDGIDLLGTETLQATVKAPDGAVGSGTTSFALLGSAANYNEVATYANVNLVTNLATDDTGVYTIFAYPKTTSTIKNWNTGATGVPAGTYTVSILYTNTLTGATQTINVPVSVLADAARPTATMTWVQDDQATAVINAASAVEDDTIVPQNIQLTTAAGSLIVARPTVVAGTTSVPFNTNDTTLVSSNDFATDDDTTPMATAPGVTTLSPDNSANKWTAAASANYIATYNTSQTASLPIVFGELTAGSASAVAATLTTSPNNLPSATPQVPAGTTTLTYTILPVDDTMSGTFAWKIDSALGGEVTPSAGVAAVSNNQATVSVTLDAAAAAAGNTLTLSSAAWVAPGTMTAYNVTQASASPVLTVPGNLVAKIGDGVSISGTITDQFGRAVSGSWLVSAAKSTASSTVVASSTASDGTFTLDVPASASPTSAGNVTYVVTATNGTTTRTSNVVVTYNASGDITSLTVATNPVSVGGLVPAVLVPGTGTTSLTTVTTAAVVPASTTVATAVPAGIQNSARMTVTATPTTSIVVTAPEGVYLSRTVSGQVNWNGGVQSLTVNSGTTISVWATKQGASTVTFTAGGLTSTAQIYAFTQGSFARNINVDKTKVDMAPNTFTSLTYTVSDVFGNPLVGTIGGLTVASAGGGTVSPTTITATNAAGQAIINYTAPTAVGTAQVTVSGTGNQFASTITGAPAAQSTVSTSITVTTAAEKTIVIVGERGTVSGKPGIIVDGATTGFEAGAKMKPWIRFPGQSSYSAGSARPTVSAVGDFEWQRKTGKKTYVYFTNEDDSVKSNRVIIPAK